jgi:large subunit ribosomal protein L17
MRHAKARLQFNRFTSWRKATLNSLLKSLFLEQSIRTTKTKALAVKPLADRLISLAKENTLAARRRAYQRLADHRLVKLLFDDIAVRFTSRNSGFTRIIGLGSRRGDGAELVILELTEIKKKEKKVHKKKKQAQPAPASAAEPAKEEPQAPKEEKKTAVQTAVQEKPPITKKPGKKFLGGLRNIFKKERDSL